MCMESLLLCDKHYNCKKFENEADVGVSESTPLQIQCLALLDLGTLRGGDFKSGSIFIEGFYHIRTAACV